MKLTIIETGQVPAPIRADWPDYPAMFASLLGEADPSLAFETVALERGAPLPDPAGLDAVLLTGSPAGVYDPEPWIAPLLDFIRWAAAEGTPAIGICFGHQAMAQAFGGKVVKSDKGWGVGRHVYDRVAPAPWMGEPPPERLALLVSHQDQVVAAPPGASVLARSDFTPYAALSYAAGPAISFQGHPEFTPAYAQALYGLRRAALGPRHDEAIASLEAPLDSGRVAAWMTTFLHCARAARPRSR